MAAWRRSLSLEGRIPATTLIQNTPDAYNEMTYVFKKRMFQKSKWVLKYVILESGNVYIYDKEDSRTFSDKFSLTGYSYVEQCEKRGKTLAIIVDSRIDHLKKKWFATTNNSNLLRLKESLQYEIKIANDDLYKDIKAISHSECVHLRESRCRSQMIPVEPSRRSEPQELQGGTNLEVSSNNYRDLTGPEGTVIMRDAGYATINEDQEEDTYLYPKPGSDDEENGDQESRIIVSSPTSTFNINGEIRYKINGSDSSSGYAAADNAYSKTNDGSPREDFQQDVVAEGGHYIHANMDTCYVETRSGSRKSLSKCEENTGSPTTVNCKREDQNISHTNSCDSTETERSVSQIETTNKPHNCLSRCSSNSSLSSNQEVDDKWNPPI